MTTTSSNAALFLRTMEEVDAITFFAVKGEVGNLPALLGEPHADFVLHHRALARRQAERWLEIFRTSVEDLGQFRHLYGLGTPVGEEDWNNVNTASQLARDAFRKRLARAESKLPKRTAPVTAGRSTGKAAARTRVRATA